MEQTKHWTRYVAHPLISIAQHHGAEYMNYAKNYGPYRVAWPMATNGFS